MPSDTVRVNAQAMPALDRRAALGSLAAGAAMLTAPRLAKAASGEALAKLIAAHANALQAFRAAIDALDAAKPADGAYINGPGGFAYFPEMGQDSAAEHVEHDFRLFARATRAIASVSPDLGAQVAAIFAAERSATLARLEALFAPQVAAKARWTETCAVEEAAMLALCSHRCATLDEQGRKLGYLARFLDSLGTEQHDALFAAMLPEA